MSDRFPTRQAVIFIHGIGEQRPMQTLRSFVNGIVTVRNSEGQKFWNNPDRLSDSFELRRLTAPGDEKHWPTTDYFEYYWAFNMRDTKYRHVITWLLRLFSRPWRLPSRIRWVWWTTLILLIVAVALAITGWLPQTGTVTQRWAWAASLVSLVLTGVFNTAVVGFLGDAARYLSPNADNIAQRQAVRSNGVRLLRQLHASGKYGRVIVVGHSLGSVIAYDILRFAWDEFSDKAPRTYSQERKKCLDSMRALIADKLNIDQRHFAERYQVMQEELWRIERKRGAPWLVTDLVTCGSPLAHASVLLATSKADLELRQREREWPTCPPIPQANEDAFTYQCGLDEECGDERDDLAGILHSSALFSCVHWTNLYYASDFIGGPLAGVFGPGIRDVKIEREHKNSAKKRYLNWLYLKGFTPSSHGMYWRQPPKKQRYEEYPPLMWNAVRRMRGAMNVPDYALVTFDTPATAPDSGADD